MTKLATTMGIELTFLPAILDKIMNRNHRVAKTYNTSRVVAGESDICEGMANTLEKSLLLRRIQFHNCHRDPGCVEVSTKPYSDKTKLFRNVRRIVKEAAALDLWPTAEWYNGGGAHIHVGLIGKDESDALRFANRMMLFGAHNPWLSWAFVGLTDSVNAEPLYRDMLLISRSTLKCKIVRLTSEVESNRNNLINSEMGLHKLENRKSRRKLESANNIVCMYRREYSRTRLRLHNLLKEVSTDTRHIDYSLYSGDKSCCMRRTGYGKFGTMEFRAFEMPEDVETLEKYVDFANAVVKYVAEQTYETYDSELIPTEETLAVMPWSKRVKGFVAMLIELGLDPNDYREERAQITRRMRYYAEIERNRKAKIAADRVAASVDADDDNDYADGASESQSSEEERAQVLSNFVAAGARVISGTVRSGNWQDEDSVALLTFMERSMTQAVRETSQTLRQSGISPTESIDFA